MSTLSAAILIFLVMDPIGNVPMFLAALKHVPLDKQRRVVWRELGIALLVLVVFLFAGQWILKAFHISGPSLSIAGGVILFLIALRMVFPGPETLFGAAPEGEPFIVPLAVPYLAGPSAIATVMLLATREPARRASWLLAIGLAWLVAAVILTFAANLSRVLGARGIQALERLMGLILTAAAVQMTLDGLRAFIAQLPA